MAELSNLCRLCAVKVDDYIGIYEEEGHKLSLEVKITKYLQIEVKPRDSLPKAVCLDCCTKLDQCSHFHESSLQAQLTLQMIFLPKLDHVVQQHLTSIGKVEDVLQQTQPVEFNHFDHDTSSMLGEEFQEPNLDPTPPVYVECVLSDNHNNANSLKDGAGLSSLVAPSKRKCRTPVRCAQDTLDAKKEPADQVRVEEEEDEEDEYLEEEEPLSSRKRRDGWDKFPWRCTDCPQELPSMQALRSHHQEVHKQTVRFLCIQCKKVYTKYYGFVSHVRRHKNHMKFCCEECGKCFSNKKVLESHRATHSDARPYVCSECGKAFRQQSALYVHNRSHQPDEVKNKYPCDQCDKKFSTKPNLVTHKRIHTGIRNYTCDQCGKSFIQKGNLDAHLLTHSSDKPHTCTICNKGFKTPLQLRKHQTVHTGAKPHQCDVCGRQFRERGTLREHHRIHTGAMPFTCEFCGKAFRFKGILTTHRRQHTGERPYSCLECQHHFTNWPNYNKHMKRRHGINTSHQPDPNKLALANMANLQQQQQHQQQHPQQHHHNNVATTPDHLGPDLSLYEDDRERGPASSTHFYAAAAGLPSVGAYMGAPLNASSMLGFYNIPQLQGLDPSAMDMLHPLQHR